jgi:hypothetical protein
VAFRGCSARAVALLPSNWKEFTYFQEEPQERPSAPSDPSYIDHDDQEPHLIQQSEPDNPVRNLDLSKQQAELPG